MHVHGDESKAADVVVVLNLLAWWRVLVWSCSAENSDNLVVVGQRNLMEFFNVALRVVSDGTNDLSFLSFFALNFRIEELEFDDVFVFLNFNFDPFNLALVYLAR